jgi:hypothetical protein
MNKKWTPPSVVSCARQILYSQIYPLVELPFAIPMILAALTEVLEQFDEPNK